MLFKIRIPSNVTHIAGIKESGDTAPCTMDKFCVASLTGKNLAMGSMIPRSIKHTKPISVTNFCRKNQLQVDFEEFCFHDKGFSTFSGYNKYTARVLEQLIDR